MSTTPDTAYLLKGIDAELWARFKACSERDGIPMKALILQLVAAYTDGDIALAARRVPRRQKGN